MIRFPSGLVILLLLFGVDLEGEESTSSAAFLEEVASRIEAKPSVKGDRDGWFFLVQELRHLATGDFWESPWEEVTTHGGDPVASMVEFHHLLAERGIRLVLAPIPAKARIYPEKLDEDFELEDTGPLAPFLDQLRDEGLTVLDFDAVMRTSRRGEDESHPYYCAQDAHFSPAAIEMLADRIASVIGVEAVENTSIRSGEELVIEITGDQIAGSEWEGKVAPETLTVTPVIQNGEVGVDPNPESPVLLLGDSHTLVFHEGADMGMHFRGAGLVDHLSLRLGEPIDLVGVRGSGMVQARKQLYFRATSEPGFWDRKRVVVWVFSEREWTQSSDRLVTVPLDR